MTSTAMFADKTFLDLARELLINSEKQVLTSTYTVFEENVENF